MVPTEPSTYPVSEIESLIAALMGVIAARVAMRDDGHIDEIHVLSDEQLHPKQIVRNIESALSAGLDLSVDRRIISVAQVRAGDDDDLDGGQFADDADATDTATDAAASAVAEPGAAPGAVAAADAVRPGSSAPADPAPDHDDVASSSTADVPPASDKHAGPETQPTEPAHSRAPRVVTRDVAIASRYVFVGYDARTQPDLEAACRVTIRRGNEVISGNGTGPSTMLGRAQAAARAVFAAISAARRDHTLGLEGTTLVERHGRSYVLVAANATSGRESMPLTGVAAMHRSPEEAAILASLQATNRWAELDG